MEPSFTKWLDLTDTIFFSRGPSAVVHLLEFLLVSITCGDTTVTRGRVEAILTLTSDCLVFSEFYFDEVGGEGYLVS